MAITKNTGKETSTTGTSNVATIVPVHDAILPYEFEGVTWAIANLGDNEESENTAVSETFEIINRNLMSLSNMRDCFCVSPPSVAAVKYHHNCYIRLLDLIASRTKEDNQERLDLDHITPVRRKFRLYPVRYFDVKNRWLKRWIELYLYGLSNLVQLSEANTWTNDWTSTSAKLIKKPFIEAYRLMCVDLFQVPITEFNQVVPAATPVTPFLLKEEDFLTYSPSTFIPHFEWFEHPYTAFFTEDRVRRVSTPTVPIGEGITETGGTQISPGEASELAQQTPPPIIQ